MKNITLMDGATGTRLWELAAAAVYERTATWRYNVEHPELVEQAAKQCDWLHIFVLSAEKRLPFMLPQ